MRQLEMSTRAKRIVLCHPMGRSCYFRRPERHPAHRIAIGCWLWAMGYSVHHLGPSLLSQGDHTYTASERLVKAKSRTLMVGIAACRKNAVACRSNGPIESRFFSAK